MAGSRRLHSALQPPPAVKLCFILITYLGRYLQGCLYLTHSIYLPDQGAEHLTIRQDVLVYHLVLVHGCSFYFVALFSSPLDDMAFLFLFPQIHSFTTYCFPPSPPQKSLQSEKPLASMPTYSDLQTNQLAWHSAIYQHSHPQTLRLSIEISFLLS